MVIKEFDIHTYIHIYKRALLPKRRQLTKDKMNGRQIKRKLHKNMLYLPFFISCHLLSHCGNVTDGATQSMSMMLLMQSFANLYVHVYIYICMCTRSMTTPSLISNTNSTTTVTTTKATRTTNTHD